MVTNNGVLVRGGSGGENIKMREKSNHYPMASEEIIADYRPLVRSYMLDTTLHGVRHIGCGGRFRRGFWIVTCLGMVVGLITTLVIQTRRVLHHPTATKQSVEYRNSLPFPAVTLCNLNQFTARFLEDNPYMKPIVTAMSPLTRHTKSTIFSDPVFKRAPSVVANYEKTQRIIIQASHQLNDTLLKCTVDNKIVSCADIFTTVVTDFGVCYTFNSRKNTNTKGQYISYVPGNKYGLGVLINVQQNQYVIGENNDAAGIRVVLHDYWETPIVQARGFNVAPGFATYAAINTKKMSFLPPPFRAFENKDCTNTSDPSFSHKLLYTDIYDYNQCILECQQAFVVAKCGCRGLYDLGSALLCSPIDYINCSLPSYDLFYWEGIGNCSCPVPCDHISYETKLSTASFPSHAVNSLVNEVYGTNFTLNEHRRNYLDLRIYYQVFKLEVTEQEALFTYGSIISSFGGQLGIFIGASFMSLIELVEFVLELVYVRCCSYFRLRRMANAEPDVPTAASDT